MSWHWLGPPPRPAPGAAAPPARPAPAAPAGGVAAPPPARPPAVTAPPAAPAAPAAPVVAPGPAPPARPSRGAPGKLLKMRAALVIDAADGFFRGTLMTSRRKRAVFGFSSSDPSVQPGTSSDERTPEVPDT